ncbi:uncharacterized protein LOC143244579 [Tachypleus tridentatus]|uniref:uncharacterized protein LOC143244579 n=1 Tax=Tachypleus tridentatus TaxID=6853 RepID=UPI003FD39FB6
MPADQNVVGTTQLSDDENTLDENEDSPLNENTYGSRRSEQETRGWDVFVDNPAEEEDLTLTSKAVEIILKIVKSFVYIFTLVLVITTAVISKGSMLFMTSHIKESRTLPVCKRDWA